MPARYDPIRDTWTTVASSAHWHTSHATTLLTDGSVLAAAGGYEEVGFTGIAERFIP